MKSFYIFTLLIFSQIVSANYDLTAGANLRSYPSPGGHAFIKGGYSAPLWGSPDKTNPFFGLIRPELKLASASIINEYDANITIYPISFIGLGYGHQEITSIYNDFTFYECESEVQCEGKMIKDYLFGKAALAYGNILSTFRYATSRNSYSEESSTLLPVGEFDYIALVAPKNETSTQRTYFLGYKIGNDMIGLISDQIKFHESQQEYQLNIVIYKSKVTVFDTAYGLGSMHSTFQKPGVVAIFKISYEFSPSLALF